MSKYKYRTKEGKLEIVGENLHKTIKALFIISMNSWDIRATTTNSEIKREAKSKLKVTDIGLIIAELRKLNLIEYEHIETGRKARGSGRYEFRMVCEFLGEVIEKAVEPIKFM